jgi:hypothetical protein
MHRKSNDPTATGATNADIERFIDQSRDLRSAEVRGQIILLTRYFRTLMQSVANRHATHLAYRFGGAHHKLDDGCRTGETGKAAVL